jgi:hypothetical protein
VAVVDVRQTRAPAPAPAIAVIAAVTLVAGFYVFGRALHRDTSPTVSVSQSAGPSASAQQTATAAAATGHTHTAAVDDRGFSLLENGHQHATAFEKPMDAATRAELARQLEVTRTVAMQYPTVKDIEAAGYHRVGPFIPGLGAHYMKFSDAVVSLNSDGVVDDNDLRHPIMWIYDGIEPTSHVAGLMYYSMSKAEPQGFAGPNDIWHYHTGLCLVYGNGGVDLPYGADQEVSKQQCDAVHGQLMKQSQWMVHAWTVPGYESSLGTFSHLNPAITCKDGSYYSVPLSSNIGTRASLCKDA